MNGVAVETITVHTAISAGSIAGAYRLDSIGTDRVQAPAEGEVGIELVSLSILHSPYLQYYSLRCIRSLRVGCAEGPEPVLYVTFSYVSLLDVLID